MRLDNLHEFTDGMLIAADRFVHEDVIEVADPEPVMDYLDSLRSLYAQQLNGVDWDSVLAEARQLVEARISIDGHWTTRQHAGVVTFGVLQD